MLFFKKLTHLLVVSKLFVKNNHKAFLFNMAKISETYIVSSNHGIISLHLQFTMS